MGESTRPQIKPRYFLRYTPVSVADTRLSTTEWVAIPTIGHYHHNYYYRILLLLLAVRNKPTTTTTYSLRDTEARLEHSPKTESKTRREKRPGEPERGQKKGNKKDE